MKFLVFVLAELIGKVRTILLGLGGAGVAILLHQSYGHTYAGLYYRPAEAVVMRLERGCLSGEPDSDGVRTVTGCDAGAENDAMPKPMSFVTFHFTDAAGKLHVAQKKVGEVAAPADAKPQDGLPVLYDPADPHQIMRPLGRQYFTLVVPIGWIGALLFIAGLFSGRLVPKI